jgi:hypothetical protein
VRQAAGIITVAIALAVATGAAVAPTAQAAPRCTLYVQTIDGPYKGWLDRTSRTSCPFARNVFRKVVNAVVRAGGSGNGPLTIRAYSPVTHRSYRMRCQVNGDLYRPRGIKAICRGGIGAGVAFRAVSA